MNRRPQAPALALVGLLPLVAAAFACPPAKELRDGDALYAEHCARCHGQGGEGDPRNLPLYPREDLTRSPMIQAHDRVLIRDRILNGYGTMPGFQHKLEAEEVGRLVNKCLTFAAPRGEKG